MSANFDSPIERDFCGAVPDPKPVGGELIVALTEDGKNVVINHPDLQPDADGCGHIVFSPDQATNLAGLLFMKANVARGWLCGHCGDVLTATGGWATARFRYCFKEECQREFYKEAQEMIRKVDPELADRLAESTKAANAFTTVDVLNDPPVPDEAYINAPNPTPKFSVERASSVASQAYLREQMRMFGEIYNKIFPPSERPLTDPASLPAHFTCPKCKRLTFHPDDVSRRYCVACHEFNGPTSCDHADGKAWQPYTEGREVCGLCSLVRYADS